jgi:dCMP deaminase
MKTPELWIDIAERVSYQSKDRSTKVGCVLVSPHNTILSTGWNGFPRGVIDTDEAKHERPAKYEWTEHAERNAVFNAARLGIATNGATAYLNWEPYPCVECMRALAQSGIIRIVGPNRPFGGVGNGVHYDTDNVTRQMVEETGVEVVLLDYEGPWTQNG